MNKKFSTLVAALLASGGLFYAVDAMILPGGDGVAKTLLTAVANTDAQGTVVGYKMELADATADFSANWTVKSATGGGLYLTVSGATDTWYLADDFTVKKAATDGQPADAFVFTVESSSTHLKSGEKYLIIGNDGSLTLGVAGNANASLATSASEIKDAVSASDAVALVIAKTEVTIGTNDAQWKEATPAKALVGNDGTNMALEAGESDDSNFYLKLGDNAYLTCNAQGVLLISATKPTKDANSAISFNSGSGNEYLKIGDKALVKDDNGDVFGFKIGTGSEADGNYFYMAASVVSDGETTLVTEAATTSVAKIFNVAKATIGTGITGSVFLNYAAGEEATISASTATSGSEFNAKEKWTISGNTLKAADGAFLTVDGSAASLAAQGTTLALEANTGAVMAGASYVVNNSGIKTGDGQTGTKLYLFDATTKELVTSLTDGVTVVLAEATSETKAASYIKTTAQIQSAEAPGIDVPGMAENVVVSEEGVVTPLSSNTANIPAPVTIKLVADTYLTVNSNGVVVETAKPAEADAWVLVNGHFKSVAAEKAGETKIWLKQGSTNGLYSLSRAAGDTYGTLVASTTEATPVTATNDAFTIGGTALTLTVDPNVAPVATIDAANKANLINGELSNGNVVYLAQGSYYANNQQAYVVEVNKTLDNQYQYKFRKMGTESEYLTVSNQTVFTSTENEGAGMALMANGQYLTITTNGNPTLGDTKLSTAFYKADVATANFSAQYILKERGNQSSFNLTLWDEKDGTSTLIENPFADADLVPMTWDGSAFKAVTASGNDQTFLLKKGNNYIVLNADDDDVWGNMGSQVTEGGYKFTTISAATLEKYLNNKLTDRNYLPYFTFSYDKNGSGLEKDGSLTAKTPIYQISVGSSSTTAGNYKLVSFEIKTGAQKGVYLTVDLAGKHKVYAEFSASNLITGDMDKDYNPLKMKYVNITFANHSSIRDKANSNVVLNGRVLSANAKESAAADEILASKPEGQWVVSMTDADANLNSALSKDGAAVADNKKFTFTNRESGESYKATSVYYLGNNKYAVESPENQIAATPATRDTMIIEPIEASLKNNKIQMDGYADLKALDVQDEQFRLLVASAEEDYYVGENHTAKSHFLGLSHDEESAVNWRIVPLTGAREYDKDGILKTVSDSIYEVRHPQYYNADKKTYFAYSDTIAIISYALQNTANGEYLTYENPQTTTIQSMICNPNFKSFTTTKEVSNAYRFVLKEKAEGLYNIVSVNGDVEYKDGYTTGENAHPFTLGDNKLYGATTLTKQGAVEVDGMYNKINSNDLFKVQKVGAPEYRLQSMGDTIRIFRQENEYDQMFEKGEFLNIGNKAQLTDMAPALYVDTAYVTRGHNSRYQYLLVVDPKYVPAEPCTVEGHPTIHPDTTYGRFLVNLIDTAYVAYKNGAIHSNKYINDGEAGETYAKLGFVYGFRTADKLYITDKNYKKSAKASDVINLSTSDFNTAKFAFRYINPINHESDGSFKVQTGYYDYDSYIATGKQPEVANDGYLKNINGVVVVAKGYDKGDKFDLAAEHSNPTANEGVNAASFSVATIDGAVVISGAEGKTVVITNVLGQTIASTVIASSEATIAVPAGVVVVAVEGEAAVKAIVK